MSGPESMTDGSIIPIGSVSSTSASYVDMNERTPLLRTGRQVEKRSNGSSIGLCILGILFVGGFTVGTYLLIIEDKDWPSTIPFDLVDRDVWGAFDIPRGLRINHSDVLRVLVFHTRSKYCTTLWGCSQMLREMQFKAINNTESDIPYNFLIGGDGQTYEGRGWSYQSGFDQIPYRNTSIAIGLIGNFTFESPSSSQIEEARALIIESIRRRKLLSTYTVFGVRNLSISSQDGKALFDQVRTWYHWKSFIDVT